MQVGFFHDAPLYLKEENEVYSIGYPYAIWKRYLEVFDEIIVCTREADKSMQQYNRYKLSSGPKVRFKLNKVYKTPLQLFIGRKKVRKPIANVISEVDACIIRLPSVIGVLAAQECIKQGKPWMAEVVACCWDSLWNYGNVKGKLLAPIMYGLNRYYLGKASHAIYVSESFLQKRYPCNGKTIGVSDVNIDETREDILSDRIKRIKDNDGSEMVLGMIGSLDVEFKGHRTAIRTVKELKDKGYVVKLKCLGEGNTDKWINLCKKLGIEENVRFCGVVPAGKPVLEWLDKIDVFIMPSLTEGLPRSMVEAMSRGCAVIGSKVGGIPELIEDDFIVPRRNYKAISNLIIKLISKKELLIEQGKRNFLKAKQYNAQILNKKRKDFFINFKNDIDNKGKFR